jgi:acyl-CoA thioesterase II
MANVLDDLVQLLALEKIEENLFRGQSQDLGWGTVFGGQVLGQALSAATQTVPAERDAHSLHAYFLRPGDVSKPIVYDVDRIRDGGSFTTRRVVAIQSGHAIFNMAVSFQKFEQGFEHQDAMPPTPPPESVPTERDRILAVSDGLPKELVKELPKELIERFARPRPFEVRPIEAIDHPFSPTPKPAHRRVWLRTIAPLPDDPPIHQALLAYASDHGFLATALFPHGITIFGNTIHAASLDHVMWFHAPFRADQWLLHVMDSPAARGGRGLVRGRIFTQDGRLVASTAQEGMIRPRRERR